MSEASARPQSLRPPGLTLALLAGLLALAGTAGADDAPAGGWDDDFFATFVTGSWLGTGVVHGNEVELERSRRLDLAGRFLRGDMKVRMANGFSFRALTFWRRPQANRYEVVWMDETGKVRTLDALGDPARKEVTAQYPDATPGDAAEWRRLVFQSTGASEYRELMYRAGPDGWEPIAEFKFSREQEEAREQLP